MRGLVAAGHPETASAACAVLSEGGNAVDAALAGLCAAVVAEPVLASLGGGGFLATRTAQGFHAGRSLVYDFFVQTPKQAREGGDSDYRSVLADFGPATQEFHVGMGSIATPGVIKGLFAVHRDLGHMPMRQIVEPAVALARRGVPINATQAYILRVVQAIIDAGPAMRAMFASVERPGELIGQGERLCLPDLANALEILAIEGDGLFYRGELAQRLADDCAANGGHLTLQDLRAYTVERRQPLPLEVFGARVELNPPPASGGLLVAFGLMLWEGLKRLDGGFGSAAHLLRLVAVMQATARARLRDVPPGRIDEQTLAALLNPRLIDRYRSEIAGTPQVSRGTTQISVVDAAGGVASVSVSNGEGSAYVLPGTGIVLNNMLGEADLQPEGPHRWARDVRMSSMMTPTLVQERDGGLLALGSGGSNRIRTAMLQALLNRLVFGLSVEDAIAAPRVHVEGERLSLEPGFGQAPAAAITGLFDTVEAWPAKNIFFGGVHAARRSASGAFEGAGDERRGGCVARC